VTGVAEVTTAADPAELAAALGPIFGYFGRHPGEETGERFARILPPGRMHVAREDGVVVAGGGAFPFELTVPGGRGVRAAGVTVVGVLPTHRRRGLLRSLMRAQLDAVHERGEPVAYLWASDDEIYGRFGYGLASLVMEIDMPAEHARLAAEPPGASLRLLSADEALERIPPLYDRLRLEHPGMFSRTRDWWETRRLADPPERRDGGGELVHVLCELDGEPAGYALYRHKVSFVDGLTDSRVVVREALATDQATPALWRYLFEIDWVAGVKASLLPPDHPLLFLTARPRYLRMRLGDGLWVRLVDVGAALSARSYAGDGAVVFEVRDTFCPWNEGRWRLEGGEASRTDAVPDLALDVTALGSAYLGGFGFAQLARGGRVEELRPGSLARADALFRAGRLPWCPEIF
jgi:predicted acetyltransferase